MCKEGGRQGSQAPSLLRCPSVGGEAFKAQDVRTSTAAERARRPQLHTSNSEQVGGSAHLRHPRAEGAAQRRSKDASRKSQGRGIYV
jgi:hypothetical protein